MTRADEIEEAFFWLITSAFVGMISLGIGIGARLWSESVAVGWIAGLALPALVAYVFCSISLGAKREERERWKCPRCGHYNRRIAVSCDRDTHLIVDYKANGNPKYGHIPRCEGRRPT